MRIKVRKRDETTQYARMRHGEIDMRYVQTWQNRLVNLGQTRELCITAETFRFDRWTMRAIYDMGQFAELIPPCSDRETAHRCLDRLAHRLVSTNDTVIDFVDYADASMTMVQE